ncbi:hypothetical protein PV325_006729 [Microctonus aethiopoides]|nr:hypothetical protein PV325_006729 [Microctonus aethiopoides]
MGKKTQTEPQTASGTVHIDEVELMRRKVAELARDLNPIEIVTVLDAKGLSRAGPNDTLTNRLVRSELRKAIGGDATDWNPEVVERYGAPKTMVGWREYLSVDAIVNELTDEIRSIRLNISRNQTTGPLSRDHTRRDVTTQPTGGASEFNLPNRSTNRPTIPSGQSMGPYQDAISFGSSENESGAHYCPPPSGNMPLSQSNSTRMIEPVNRRERNSPTPPRYPNQPPQPSAFGGSSWFKNTTFNFPGSQVRSVSKLDSFRAPDYQRVSERVVKMGKNMRDRNIKFSGQIKGSGEEFLWLFTEAIKQYGLTEDETSDSQAKLWEEIRARTQGPGESIPEYLISMQAMFMHFDLDVPMHQQMEIIFKNLHPKFIMHIDPRTINDYDDFAGQGEMIENKLRGVAQYAPPPPPEKSVLSSSAWSQNNDRKAWGMAATETKEEINATESAPLKNPQIKPKQAKTLATQTESIPITPTENNMVCYNCDQPGHFSRACPLAR